MPKFTSPIFPVFPIILTYSSTVNIITIIVTFKYYY